MTARAVVREAIIRLAFALAGFLGTLALAYGVGVILA